MLKSLVRKAAFVGSFGVMVTVIVLIAPTPRPAQPAVPRCASLEAQALISPSAAIAGAFACIAPELAQANSFTSDADIQAVAAQAPVFTSYHYLGPTAAGYYFEFSTGNAVTGCFRFHIDTSGHVDRIGSKAGSCPRPLP